ncbi:MAG: MBL fold metallo-hydrolase [Clostridia bacterium]|nr:MBL fold metallo-hydrolase [Clostridia bacterium]
MIRVQSIFPGIDHLTDGMGVCMTLLQGTERALLFDTGYGTEDVRQAVAPLIHGKELTVLLSHGHHDHILGSRWFSRVFLAREDFPEYRLRTGLPQREKVAAQAAAKGVGLPADFLTAPCPGPEAFLLPDRTAGFPSRQLDLGGLDLLVIQVPGHTPGSLMVYVEQRQLLLTADNWNPCTWLWFPSAVPAPVWRENMLKVLDALPVQQVLCSHHSALWDGEVPRRFIAGLTDSRLALAVPVSLDPSVDTRQASPDGEGMVFVFDYSKFRSCAGA